MSLFLCVDCGGTKTAAAIADVDGKIIGRSFAGPSNITYLTSEGFLVAVTEAVTAALKAAFPTAPEAAHSLPPIKNPFVAAWFGISGADSPAAIDRVSQLLSDLLGLPIGPKLTIANDTHLLAAPIRMYPKASQGVVVIAGTGSIAVSFEDVAGKLEERGRVGGWGWILGDEGSGFDVGKEALRQLLKAHDETTITGARLPQSILIGRILELFGVNTIMEILGYVYQPDPVPGARTFQNRTREKRISGLPPIIFEAAFDNNDPLALTIVKTCAGRLADQIARLLGDGLEDPARAVVAAQSVLSFGGSLVGVEGYRTLIINDLARRGHCFRHAVFVSDAASTGATALASSFSIQMKPLGDDAHS